MAKARILVVDDSRPTVTLVAGVLKKQGYEVHCAYDGKQGLELAREVNPDLLVLDIMMPEMNGYEVCWRLQQDPATASIAILMLSAKGGVDQVSVRSHQIAGKVKDRLKGYDVGAVDFMTKPVKGSDLAKRVKALLWAGGLAV